MMAILWWKRMTLTSCNSEDSVTKGGPLLVISIHFFLPHPYIEKHTGRTYLQSLPPAQFMNILGQNAQIVHGRLRPSICFTANLCIFCC